MYLAELGRLKDEIMHGSVQRQMDNAESLSDLRVEANAFRVEVQALSAETYVCRVEDGASRMHTEEVSACCL